MSANFYCWEPSLNLDPASEDFQNRIDEIHKYRSKPAPPEGMLKLVDALLARYPDLTETDETVWADGPMKNNILGRFINMGVIWNRYAEAAGFIIFTANGLGLHAFDPQDGTFYPAPNTIG